MLSELRCLAFDARLEVWVYNFISYINYLNLSSSRFFEDKGASSESSEVENMYSSTIDVNVSI